MAYASASDLITLWGELFLDDLLPEDVVRNDALSGALRLASAEIDGYLSAHYRLPLPAASDVLTRPCCDIAVYILANTHQALTETIEKRYEQATDLLVRIAAGKAGLGLAEQALSANSDPEATSDGAAFYAPPRVHFRGVS